MSNHATRVRALREQIAGLRRILADMDPASGVSMSFRRGVARDNEDREDDAERRPWVTVESSALPLARVAIQAAIDAAEESIRFWIADARFQLRDLSTFIQEMDGGAK